VETRAQQVTPYVSNLLALSAALQENFTPTDPARPPAARFLLVSDIHGANQYPVMKRIVDEEQITAVIDLGDLLNLGRVTEAEVPGIFTAIRNLRVPTSSCGETMTQPACATRRCSNGWRRYRTSFCSSRQRSPTPR